MPLPNQIRNNVRRQATRVLTTGNRFRRFDQLRQRHFWSAAVFNSDAAGYVPSGSVQLFQTPPGQVGQGFQVPLTPRDTNWPSANRVPDNLNLEVTEIGITVGIATTGTGVATDSTADQQRSARIANAFLMNTVVEIEYLTNQVPLGLAQDFAQAAGPQQGTYQTYDTASTITDYRLITNGFSSPALRRRFKIPILLQHGETFSFVLNTPRSYYVGDAAGSAVQSSIYARLDFFATESFVEKS